jgi:hypothetical protein
MLENQEIRPASVVGPLGEPLTLDRLPSRVTRWVARRKAEVVAAVNGGLISEEDACRRYEISKEELISWQTGMDRAGMKGLRVSRLKEYRTIEQPVVLAEAASPSPS